MTGCAANNVFFETEKGLGMSDTNKWSAKDAITTVILSALMIAVQLALVYRGRPHLRGNPLEEGLV
jgi:hypothetical protein